MTFIHARFLVNTWGSQDGLSWPHPSENACPILNAGGTMHDRLPQFCSRPRFQHRTCNGMELQGERSEGKRTWHFLTWKHFEARWCSQWGCQWSNVENIVVLDSDLHLVESTTPQILPVRATTGDNRCWPLRSCKGFPVSLTKIASNAKTLAIILCIHLSIYLFTYLFTYFSISILIIYILCIARGYNESICLGSTMSGFSTKALPTQETARK